MGAGERVNLLNEAFGVTHGCCLKKLVLATARPTRISGTCKLENACDRSRETCKFIHVAFDLLATARPTCACVSGTCKAENSGTCKPNAKMCAGSRGACKFIHAVLGRIYVYLVIY
jgi:hypothetical protein